MPMLIYRRTWWSVTGITWIVMSSVALATVAPGALVFLALFVAVVTAACTLAVAPLNGSWDDHARAVARHCGVAVAATVAVIGMVSSLGGYGALLSTLFAVTCPPAIEQLLRWQEHRRIEYLRAQVPDEEFRGVSRPSRMCSEMTTSELVYEWRASFSSLHKAQTTAAVNNIVERRQRCLDELERRDPEGIRRWLESGARAASDPMRYMHQQRDDRRSTE